MKKIILFIFFLIASTTVFAQTAFYDAQYLNTIKSDKLPDILKEDSDNHIALSEQERKTVGAYQAFFSNPFGNTMDNTELDISYLKTAIAKYNDYIAKNATLVNLVKTILEQSKEMKGMESLPSISLPGGISLLTGIATGNFNLSPEQQTTIIDGLTKYYAEEFRKARLLTYMQVFENTIGKIGELELLFPKTYSKLQNTDPSKFPELGDEYKSIFNEDLKSLLDNLINHIDNHTALANPTLESKLKWLTAANVKTIKDNEYFGCIKITADIGSRLINNYHPVDLLNFLDTKYYESSLLTSAAPLKSDKITLILHGLNLVQRNLLDTTKTKDSQFANVWLSVEELKKLNTIKEWKYFAGLLYQQDRAFFNKFFWDASSETESSVTNNDLLTIQKKLNAILSTLVELQDFKANLKEENIKDNFLGYMNLLLKAIESANYFTNADFPDIKKYFKIATFMFNIYDNARKKDYNNTIYYAFQILNEFLSQNNTYLDVMAKIEKYGTFMTDVINAKNSDEVKECIKKHAAPPSSFILKREFRNTLSITGQPGYFAGIERFDGPGNDFKFISGITLPLGFEFTLKLKKGNTNSQSIGIFLQLIDLGAMLNFRLGDTASTLPDKVEFKQLFSPGGSLTYGLKNSPLTLGLGYQYTPELRKVTLANGNELYPNGHRVFVRLAWDIPLINISKSKLK